MVFTHLQRFVYTPGKSALLFTTPHCQLWNMVAFTIGEAQYWVLRYISAQWEFIFRKHRHDPDVTFITHHSNKNAGLHTPCMELITLCMARTLTNATGEWHGVGRGGGQLVFSVPSSQAEVMVQEAEELGHRYKASDWQMIDSGT